MSAHLPNPFDSALVSEMRAGSATVETNIPVSAVAANPELAEGPVVAPRHTESFASRSPGTRGKKDQVSIPEPAPAPLPTLRAETPAGALLSFAPAAFSFQPDFEKLFDSIFKLSDMEAMLICADEELRVETLLGDSTGRPLR